MMSSAARPIVVFPTADVLSHAINTHRPELSKSFKRSKVRRALRWTSYSVKNLDGAYTLYPVMELFDTRPDVLLSIIRDWSASISVKPSAVSHREVLSFVNEYRSVPVNLPFDFAYWLVTYSQGPSGSNRSSSEFAAGRRLGLDSNMARAFACPDDAVVAEDSPLLALAAFHLDIDLGTAMRLRKIFNVYLDALYRDDTQQSVYDALRSDVVDTYTKLAVDVGGVIDDVSLWLMFACITSIGKHDLSSLMASRIDPWSAVELWVKGFDVASVIAILANDIDMQLALTMFSPRAGFMEFDLERVADEPLVFGRTWSSAEM